MSDSSIGLKPVIDEPSKPIPPSNASSSSEELIEKLLQLTEDVGEPEADEAHVPDRRPSLMTSSALVGGLSGIDGLPERLAGEAAPYP